MSTHFLDPAEEFDFDHRDWHPRTATLPYVEATESADFPGTHAYMVALPEGLARALSFAALEQAIDPEEYLARTLHEALRGPQGQGGAA